MVCTLRCVYGEFAIPMDTVIAILTGDVKCSDAGSSRQPRRRLMVTATHAACGHSTALPFERTNAESDDELQRYVVEHSKHEMSLQRFHLFNAAQSTGGERC